MLHLDFRCWTFPEIAFLVADQKERGLWRREWGSSDRAEKRLRMSLIRAGKPGNI